MRKMICRRRKFRYIKTQISLGWHLPNTVGISFKHNVVFKKKSRRKNAETEDETSASAPNFSKKGLGTRILKRLTCECFPHQLRRVKSSVPMFHKYLHQSFLHQEYLHQSYLHHRNLHQSYLHHRNLHQIQLK